MEDYDEQLDEHKTNVCYCRIYQCNIMNHLRSQRGWWHIPHIMDERYLQNSIKNMKITTHFGAFFLVLRQNLLTFFVLYIIYMVIFIFFLFEPTAEEDLICVNTTTPQIYMVIRILYYARCYLWVQLVGTRPIEHPREYYFRNRLFLKRYLILANFYLRECKCMRSKCASLTDCK